MSRLRKALANVAAGTFVAALFLSPLIAELLRGGA